MARRERDGDAVNLLLPGNSPRVPRRSFLRGAALLGAALGVSGAAAACTGEPECNCGATAAPAATIPKQEERLLNIYNWSDYIDDRSIPAFQAHLNLRVNYDVYSSNDDLLAKLRAGPTNYDLIVPTNQFIPTYRRLDLIQALPRDLITNIGNVDKQFVETDYDPGLKYTVPYQWGTTGIGYNVKKVPGGKVDSWKALFEPSGQTVGKVTLLREVVDLIGCTLIYLGKDPNSTKDADLAQVKDVLRGLKPKVKKFTSDTYKDELAANEIALAQGYSGDFFQAQDDNRDIEYAIPKEGSLSWVDVMAIPKGAPHPRNAAEFMNYVLQPKVNARISSYVSYATPVSLAKPLIPADQVEDPLIYPPDSIKLSIVTLSGDKIEKWQAVYDEVLAG
jgi:spermidine/putrescine transport system substrate-binding protein